MDSPHEGHRFPQFILSHGCNGFSSIRQRFVSDLLLKIPFPADGVARDAVFTFGAGVQWSEAYEAAKQRNRVIVGGVCARGSIAVGGGWLSGGGHSPIASNYGLGTQKKDSPDLVESHSHREFVGVDNVLEITIVTADGDHIIANAYRNKDLFWALRGGGGGTWGVVTSVTYKTHPSTPFSAASILVNSTNADSTQKFLTEIIRLTPSLVEQGYGGDAYGSSEQIQFLFMSPNVTAEQTQATFSPLFEFTISLPGLSVMNTTTVFQDFWEFYYPIGATDDLVGVPTEISTWLLPKDVFETDQPGELASELLKLSVFGYL